MKVRHVAIETACSLCLILSVVLTACGPTPLPTVRPPATPTEAVAAATYTPTAAATVAPGPTTKSSSAPATTPAPTATTPPAPIPALSPTAEPTVTAAPPLSPTVSGASLTLNPGSGPPGTSVQGSGYLPGGPSAGQAKANESFQNATVCWGECPGGLGIEDVPVEWSSTQPGQFTLEFTVPAIPWLGADGPHPLVPGGYTVGIQCLAPAQPGCLLQGPQVTAAFHLLGPTPPECKQGPCGQLEFSPPQGAPGTLVQVGGWAPLTEIISTPFGYSLVIEQSGQTEPPPQIGAVQQAMNGDLSGSFRVPLALPPLGLLQPGSYTLALEAVFISGGPAVAQTLPGTSITPLGPGGGTRVTLAPTAFTVAPAPEWAALTALQPLLFQDTERLYTPSVAFDPVDSRRLAYCAPGGIQLSTDGGETWSSISTADVAKVAATTSYPLFAASEGPASCHSVTLDANHPQSFYAVFQTAQEAYGAPPIFFMGYLTTDAGTTWQAVPPPPGYTIAQFGGFRATTNAVQALFAGQPSGPEQAPSFAVEQTADGGRTWAPAGLTCPPSGPCVRWGSAPSQISGMGADYPQAIELSTDGGQTWTAPDWPVQVILNGGPSELVTLSASTVALLSAQDDYPFRISPDKGKTWLVINLPALVGSDGNLPLYPALQMLPNGALLAQSQNSSTWQMLLPAASEWCTVAGVSLPATAELFVVNSGQIWWLENPSAPTGAPVPQKVTISDMHCGPQPR
jgi:hypothetical protein